MDMVEPARRGPSRAEAHQHETNQGEMLLQRHAWRCQEQRQSPCSCAASLPKRHAAGAHMQPGPKPAPAPTCGAPHIARCPRAQHLMCVAASAAAGQGIEAGPAGEDLQWQRDACPAAEDADNLYRPQQSELQAYLGPLKLSLEAQGAAAGSTVNSSAWGRTPSVCMASAAFALHGSCP